jgi:transposase
MLLNPRTNWHALETHLSPPISSSIPKSGHEPDLRVNRMTHNHCLAKSIHDAAWSAFFSHLSCKAEEAGRQFMKVNPAYTSQECSRCHHRQKMPLGERVYHCPCCLLVLDRDLNASKNILAVGLHSLGLSIEAPAFTHGE